MGAFAGMLKTAGYRVTGSDENLYPPMSDMLALIVPVTLSVRGFLAEEESDPAELDLMQTAWFKAVTVTLVLWSRPYAGDLW